MKEYCAVYVTCGSKDEARHVAQGILEKRLAACVNIVPLVESHYWWQGKLEMNEESLCIIKTKGSALTALKDEVLRLHSYTVPEFIALTIKDGNKDYLDWIEKEVSAQ
jgi:periplasmic divalent cation tolerance protein